MKPSDDLFELIKSLTHSEKRYFKLISSKSVADNLYVKLFDAMDAQIVYDEVHIKEQFKGQKFVKQIHVLKNYLYNILLKSLAAYHNEKSEVSHVLEMLQFIEVLFEKGFYGQCKKMVKRAQKICLDGELLMIEYNINEWELKLLLRENCFSEIKEKNKRQKYILDRLNENNLYKDQSTIVYQKILESANAITNNEVDYIE